MARASYRANEVLHIVETKLNAITRSRSHNTCWYYLDGKKHHKVTIPHGRKPLPTGTLRAIVRQLLLTPDEFDSLMACPLTGKQYQEIVRSIDTAFLPTD